LPGESLTGAAQESKRDDEALRPFPSDCCIAPTESCLVAQELQRCPLKAERKVLRTLLVPPPLQIARGDIDERYWVKDGIPKVKKNPAVVAVANHHHNLADNLACIQQITPTQTDSAS
jgi:hypothetical protein